MLGHIARPASVQRGSTAYPDGTPPAVSRRTDATGTTPQPLQALWQWRSVGLVEPVRTPPPNPPAISNYLSREQRGSAPPQRSADRQKDPHRPHPRSTASAALYVEAPGPRLYRRQSNAPKGPERAPGLVVVVPARIAPVRKQRGGDRETCLPSRRKDPQPRGGAGSASPHLGITGPSRGLCRDVSHRFGTASTDSPSGGVGRPPAAHRISPFFAPPGHIGRGSPPMPESRPPGRLTVVVVAFHLSPPLAPYVRRHNPHRAAAAQRDPSR